MPSPTSWSPFSYSSLTGDNLVDSLIGGTQWSSTTISFSFPGATSVWSSDWTTGYGTFGTEPWVVGYEDLYSSDKTAVRDILASWSSVSNLVFTEVADDATTAGDLRFAYADSSVVPGAQAWSYFPGDYAFGGDVWFNQDGTNYYFPWTAGSYEYQTVVHEIGHALGLKHPFDAESLNATIIPTALDSRSYTVMSYSAAPGNASTYFSYEPTTPMVLDIAAIQAMYGANTTHNAGDDTYIFSRDGSYHQTIWDSGGQDTIVYDCYSVGGIIDLRAGVGYGCKLGEAVYVLNQYGTELYSVRNIWIADGVVIENATGGWGSDQITGNAAANILSGGIGADTLDGGLGADTLIGGTWGDTYIVDDPGDVVQETSTSTSEIDLVKSSVSFTLGANLEKLTLTGSADIDGTGNSLANILVGNAAANVLDGGTGIDTLAGGAGNDTYVLDNAGDIVTEYANEGIDTLRIAIATAGATHTLGANLENATLITTAAANLTGNGLSNVLTGNAAANVLDGGAGADSLIGGLGNDTYVIDNAGDTITENLDEGTDTVRIAIATAGATHTLGADLENATLITTAIAHLTGNELNNVLTGNAAANTLNGGLGADTLIGGLGNDTYLVDDLGDTVQETSTLATEIDLVQAGVSFTLTANLERLTLTGSADINGTGNTLANLLTGNNGANVLDGGAGADTLAGGLGDDTYVVDLLKNATTGLIALQDTVTDTGGSDTLKLRAGALGLTAAQTVTLTATLEHLDLSQTGTNALNLTGNTGNNTLTGNAAANVLNGGTGADSLIGGAGNDTYVVDNLGDAITEGLNAGTDSVQAAVSHTLAANVENLVLTGSAANGTGNELANTLTGNGLANTLTGDAGNDTLIGGMGKDTLTGGDGADSFDFNTVAETGITSAAWDVITDFLSGTDRIDLSTLDANTATAANDAFTTLIAGTAAFTAAGQLKLLDGVVYGNVDADATAEFAIQLVGVGSVVLADFVV